MPGRTDWENALIPLLKKYKGKKHPLDYQNVYQLLVMVVLSAQSSDEAINMLAPDLFRAYPDMRSLSGAAPEDLYPYIRKVRNFGHKAKWLTEIASQVRSDEGLVLTQEALTRLPGIGRKSANVIIREAGKEPEGIIVDLHVIRVAQRLGIVREEDPKKIEKELMEILPRKDWDIGMALSFLGREICHPKPECEKCLMREVCRYYETVVSVTGVVKKVIMGKQGTEKKTIRKKTAQKNPVKKKSARQSAVQEKTVQKKAVGKKAPVKKSAKKKSK